MLRCDIGGFDEEFHAKANAFGDRRLDGIGHAVGGYQDRAGRRITR